MFKSDITLYGKHAEYLKRYSKDKQGEEQFLFNVTDNNGKMKTIYLFDTMLQAYEVACMVGIIEHKSVELDRSKVTYARMFAEVVAKNNRTLERICHMMILAERQSSIDQTIKDAFTIDKNEVEIQDKLNSYARGGLELINEQFKSCHTCEDVVNQFILFIEKYNISNQVNG